MYVLILCKEIRNIKTSVALEYAIDDCSFLKMEFGSISTTTFIVRFSYLKATEWNVSTGNEFIVEGAADKYSNGQGIPCYSQLKIGPPSTLKFINTLSSRFPQTIPLRFISFYMHLPQSVSHGVCCWPDFQSQFYIDSSHLSSSRSFNCQIHPSSSDIII